MPLTNKTTLEKFLADREPSEHSAELNALIQDTANACKAIAKAAALGHLADAHGDLPFSVGGEVNVQGEVQKSLDVTSNALFITANESTGTLAGMASEEMELPYRIPQQYPRGHYLLVFDPLDGSSNIDVNVTVGSIFSVLRAPDCVTTGSKAMEVADFLQSGRNQVAAGYAIYGPSTMLVLTFGQSVNGFTLDPVLGQFVLTHADMRIPTESHEFAINSSNTRFWEEPVSRYVDECLAGTTGPRKKDFNMRWVASMVAEAHRILLRGGLFLYPRDSKQPAKAGRLRLLYEANPIGLIMQSAGGSSSTGYECVLDVLPTALHERIGLVFGSKAEVERVEKYHREWNNEAISVE